MKFFIWFIIFLVSQVTLGQKKYLIDTSYTIKSVYNKEIKKYPEISVVTTKKNTGICVKNNVVYKVYDNNRKLKLDVFYPKKKQYNPAVVLLHGGGWKSGNKEQMHNMAINIASNGYACFTVAYRRSPEAIYPAAIVDVKNAIKFIKSKYQKFKVDTTKVTILGCSSGGQMATLVGATNNNKDFEDSTLQYKTSSKVQAIVDIDGILAFHHPKSKEALAASQWLGGSYEQKPEIWQQASALSHVSNKFPPILFITSEHERFSAGKEDLITVLNQYGIYNQSEQIHHSPHSFWFFNPYFDLMIQYITLFLDKLFK